MRRSFTDARVLLRFQFSNFRSFRTAQDLVLVNRDENDPIAVSAIYGANASGKTNVIRALRFMASAVSSSQREWVPDGPVPLPQFALDEESSEVSSSFSVVFTAGGVRFDYDFQATRTRIERESLHAFRKGRKQLLFLRNKRRGFRFGPGLKGANRGVAAVTRENSLFLSAAAQNNHAALVPVYNWFAKEIAFMIEDRSAGEARTIERWDQGDFRKRVVDLLRLADFGVGDMRRRQLTLPGEVRQKIEAFLDDLAASSGIPAPAGMRPDKYVIELLHEAGPHRLVPLARGSESHGTLAFLGLAGLVVESLQNGSVLCVDELDASLHPLLVREIVRLYRDRDTNPKGAQLVFTSHETDLLREGLLRREEVWFTDKNRKGESSLYPLTDFLNGTERASRRFTSRADTAPCPMCCGRPSTVQRKATPMRKSDRLGRGPSKRDPRPRVLIVCEGAKTESGYFEGLRSAERLAIELKVVPAGSPKTVVEKAVELKNRALSSHDAFEQIWCVFDIDEHPKIPDAIQQAQAHGVSLAVSNPCFELFVLLHFQDRTAPIHRHKAQSLCRKHMPGYQKNLAFDKLAPLTGDALGRAAALDERHHRNGNSGANPSTGVHRLVSRIRALR